MLAIVREVPRSIASGERMHVAREPIDLEKAREEHRRYVGALSGLGCEILSLEEEPELADSVFVEDTACVFDEIAVLTRPGAPSRRPEVDSIAEVLQNYRRVVRIEPPATLDGGDILVFGKRVFVGLSSRTDGGGVGALAEHLAPHGYTVEGVPLGDCLHLKSAVSVLGEECLLVHPGWVDGALFGAARIVEIDPTEPFAANAVFLENSVIVAEAFPRTRERLESSGLRVVCVPAGELAKAEGGVTCCSLLLKSP
jgi:dimethylargininase